jgi:hypothetical protein
MQEQWHVTDAPMGLGRSDFSLSRRSDSAARRDAMPHQKEIKMKRYHQFEFADGTWLTSFYPITRRSARRIHLSDASIVRAVRWKTGASS